MSSPFCGFSKICATFALVCLFFAGASTCAFANTVTYDLTANAALPNNGGLTATGTYTVDLSNSTVIAWSFVTVSSIPALNGLVFSPSQGWVMNGSESALFVAANSSAGYIWMFLQFSNSQLSALLSLPGNAPFSMMCLDAFTGGTELACPVPDSLEIYSATITPAASTPEPSSLLLLATGLLSLGPLIHCFAQSRLPTGGIL